MEMECTRKILNRKGAKIDTWGNPNITLNQLQYELIILFFLFLFSIGQTIIN